MLLDHDLKPTSLSSVDEIWVEDSRGRRVEQWRAEPLDKGMLQQEFTLAEETVLGTWTIKLKTGDKKLQTTFKVAEYVLSKFEVIIEAPNAVLRDDDEVTWRVCGKYTHGGSVKGVVKSNFTSSYRSSNWRAPPPTIKSTEVTTQVL